MGIEKRPLTTLLWYVIHFLLPSTKQDRKYLEEVKTFIFTTYTKVSHFPSHCENVILYLYGGGPEQFKSP